MSVIGESTAECTAEFRAAGLETELYDEVEQVGEIKDMHSGGLVVLRYAVGLAAGARTGGLQLLERVLRWTL